MTGVCRVRMLLLAVDVTVVLMTLFTVAETLCGSTVGVDSVAAPYGFTSVTIEPTGTIFSGLV